MGDLVRRAAGALARHDTARPAASTARVAFDGAVVRWADLPHELRVDASSAALFLAECVVVVDDDGLAQHALAWRAFEDVVHTVALQRPLRPGRPGGRARPAGPWRTVGHSRWTVGGRPRRREGVVGSGAVASASQAAGAAGPAQAADDSTGAAAAAYLPAEVRSGLLALVPDALWCVGEIVQEQRDGGPVGQAVTVLRADAARAVVVSATRRLAPGVRGRDERAQALARTPWFVEQTALDLGPRARVPRTLARP